jgi:hypothetical protein
VGLHRYRYHAFCHTLLAAIQISRTLAIGVRFRAWQWPIIVVINNDATFVHYLQHALVSQMLQDIACGVTPVSVCSAHCAANPAKGPILTACDCLRNLSQRRPYLMHVIIAVYSCLAVGTQRRWEWLQNYASQTILWPFRELLTCSVNNVQYCKRFGTPSACPEGRLCNRLEVVQPFTRYGQVNHVEIALSMLKRCAILPWALYSNMCATGRKCNIVLSRSLLCERISQQQ